MLRPGFPRLSHPGVAHAIPSIAFIPQVFGGRDPHDLEGWPINSERRKHPMNGDQAMNRSDTLVGRR